MLVWSVQMAWRDLVRARNKPVLKTDARQYIRAHQTPRRRHKNVQSSHTLMTYDIILRVLGLIINSIQPAPDFRLEEPLMSVDAAAVKRQTLTHCGFRCCLLNAGYKTSRHVTGTDTPKYYVAPADRSTFEPAASSNTVLTISLLSPLNR